MQKGLRPSKDARHHSSNHPPIHPPAQVYKAEHPSDLSPGEVEEMLKANRTKAKAKAKADAEANAGAEGGGQVEGRGDGASSPSSASSSSGTSDSPSSMARALVSAAAEVDEIADEDEVFEYSAGECWRGEEDSDLEEDMQKAMQVGHKVFYQSSYLNHKYFKLKYHKYNNLNEIIHKACIYES